MKRRGRVELTQLDIAGLADGTITMSEIAARCGASRSAVSDYVKRHGIAHSLRPGVGVRAQQERAERLLPTLAGMADEAERQKLILSFRRATLLNLLDEASRIAAAGNLAPKSLRDLTGAVTDLETRLIALGLLPDEGTGDTGQFTMTIQIMSPAEADSIRAAAEQEQDSLFDNDQAEIADEMPEPAKVGFVAGRDIGAAVHRAGTARLAAVELLAIESRLAAIQASKGRAGLRAAALRLGIEGSLPRNDSEKIKAMILEQLADKPELAEKLAA